MCILKKLQARPGARKMATLCFFLLPGVFFLILYLLPPPSPTQQQLVVEAPRLGHSLYSIPVSSGDIFELSYVHSVSRQPVEGRFEITTKEKIRPLTTTFDTFGPGLPEPGDTANFEIQNGSFVVFHDEEPREEISLFVAPITEDRLFLNGEQYDLAGHLENPTLIKIYVTPE